MKTDFMSFLKTFSSGAKALNKQSQNHRDKITIRLTRTSPAYSCFVSISNKIEQNNA